MEELVTEIAKMLVDHPEDIQVKAVVSTNHTIFELRAHPHDVGKLIGREGRTINAIRSLLIAAGARRNRRFSVTVIDKDDSAAAVSAD